MLSAEEVLVLVAKTRVEGLRLSPAVVTLHHFPDHSLVRDFGSLLALQHGLKPVLQGKFAWREPV